MNFKRARFSPLDADRIPPLLPLAERSRSKSQPKPQRKDEIENRQDNLIRNGAPGRIRTPDPLVRSQVLYPTELPAPKERMRIMLTKKSQVKQFVALFHSIEMAEKEGFEPSMELLTPYSLSRGAPSASRPFLRINL